MRLRNKQKHQKKRKKFYPLEALVTYMLGLIFIGISTIILDLFGIAAGVLSSLLGVLLSYQFYIFLVSSNILGKITHALGESYNFLERIKEHKKKEYKFQIFSYSFSRSEKNNIHNHNKFFPKKRIIHIFKKYLWESVYKPIMLYKILKQTGVIFIGILLMIIIGPIIENILFLEVLLIGFFLIMSILYILYIPYKYIKYKRLLHSHENNFYLLNINKNKLLYTVEENEKGGLDYYIGI